MGEKRWVSLREKEKQHANARRGKAKKISTVLHRAVSLTHAAKDAAVRTLCLGKSSPCHVMFCHVIMSCLVIFYSGHREGGERLEREGR